MNNLKLINCSYSNVAIIEDMPSLVMLDCSNSRIKKLPDLPQLNSLYCSNTKIINIDHLKKINYLFAHNGCLLRIPIKHDFKSISVSNIPITKIPDITGCFVQCYNCKWLNPNERDVKKLKILQRFAKKILHKRNIIIYKNIKIDRYLSTLLYN
jgi:Leucine-rich repeat (LRR) protein